MNRGYEIKEILLFDISDNDENVFTTSSILFTRFFLTFPFPCIFNKILSNLVYYIADNICTETVLFSMFNSHLSVQCFGCLITHLVDWQILEIIEIEEQFLFK